MSKEFSNRHQGNLGGIFSNFGDCNSLGISIKIPEDLADYYATQHCAWMLVNILARCEGIVDKISIFCPPSIPIKGKIIPLANRDQDLQSALVEGGNRIGIVPIVVREELEKCIELGFNRHSDSIDISVWGSGWAGGICREKPASDFIHADQKNPIGPYIAAAIAAGEIFKEARLKEKKKSNSVRSFYYSAWEREAVKIGCCKGPQLKLPPINAILAGVGAVGSTFLHCLWAIDGIAGNLSLCDNDEKGIENSNLNRYSIFGIEHVGKQKATAAMELLADSSFSINAQDTGIENISVLPPEIVSAVDSNKARHAIQNRYPGFLLSASTFNLRAEVLRCGPPGIGACLACYNTPERIKTDIELKSEVLRRSDEENNEAALKLGVTLDQLKEWAKFPKCSTLDQAASALFRADDTNPEFSVGFVSVMAGVMLSVEYLRSKMEGSSNRQRSVFQFLDIESESNKSTVYRRDPACPKCDPTSAAIPIWRRRYSSFFPEE